MLIMKAGLNLIDNFLWETYEIDWRTSIRKHASSLEEETSDKAKLEDLIKGYSLNLHFINRMKRDPGFEQYLIKEIENDKEIIVKLNNHIDGIEKKYIGSNFDSLFNLDRFEPGSKSIELDKKLAYDFETTCQNESGFKETKLAFLKKRLQIAESENNLDEKTSVESLLHEVETGYIGDYDLFQKNKIYQKKFIQSHNLLNSIGVRYLAENLSFVNIYLEKRDSSFFKYIPEPDLRLVHSILQMHPTKPDINRESIDRYAKFVQDSLNISYVMWFESKDEHQKLSILNHDYEFTLNDSDIKKFISLHGEVELIKIAQLMMVDSYYFEAKKLYEFLCEQSVSEGEKSVYFSNMAFCCREIGDYDSAIHNHLEEYRIICEAENELKDIHTVFYGSNFDSKNDQVPNISELKEILYFKAISAKNIAENYLHKGNEEKFQEYLSCFYEIVDKLETDVKINLYFNIASTYRRVYKNKEEYNTLLKCKSLLEEKEDNEIKKLITEEIDIRLKEYNTYIECYSSEKDDNVFGKLIFQDRCTFAEKFIEKGNELFGTFQFTKAVAYFKRANEILESNDLNFNIALCYFYLYLLNIKNEDESKRIDYLINAKNCLAGIESQDLIKAVNKDALLLRGFTFIADGIETREMGFMAIGREHFKKYIMFIYSIKSETHEYILPSLKECLILSLQFKKKNVVKGFFEDLIVEIKKYEKRVSPYFLVGYILIDYFMDDIASYFIDKGLTEEKEENKRLDLLDLKAHLNLIMSNSKNAIKCYEEAIKISDKEPELWFKLSIAYARSFQYTKAIDSMHKSSELMQENSEIYKEAQSLIKQFTKLSKEQLEIESLPEDEERIRSTLISAEEELLELDNLDYSGVLMKYSKAIQIIMEENVSKPIRNKIKIRNKNLKYKYVKNKQNPFIFKKILNENKSATSSEWKGIKSDLKNSNQNKLSIEIKEELLNILDSDIMDTLECLGEILKIDRNKGCHDDIIRLDTATELRNKAVPFMNKLINYFY